MTETEKKKVPTSEQPHKRDRKSRGAPREQMDPLDAALKDTFPASDPVSIITKVTAGAPRRTKR